MARRTSQLSPSRAPLPSYWSWPSAQLDRRTNLLKLSCEAALLPVADDGAGPGPCDWNCEGEADEWLCALASSEAISTSMVAPTGGRSGDPMLLLFFSGQNSLAFWVRVSQGTTPPGQANQRNNKGLKTDDGDEGLGDGQVLITEYLDSPPRRPSGTYRGCPAKGVWGVTREEAELLLDSTASSVARGEHLNRTSLLPFISYY